MALSRRTGTRFQASIWPGFVDAMTGLLLVLMFLLTIFMVVQYVLRDTISGQETILDKQARELDEQASELDKLSLDVSALAESLGLERDRSADLDTRIGELNSTIDEASSRIVSFEEQVTSLLADRENNLGQIADLEGARATLISEQETLQLALAGLRDEVDAQAETARLAAARRQALDALVADLQNKNADAQQAQTDLTQQVANLETQLSDEEKNRLLEAAAAKALRDKLKNADAELTAMTLSLEEQRRKAEETLAMLAAAQTAGDDLDIQLAAALLARDNVQQALNLTQSGLGEKDAEIARLQKELAAAVAENLAISARVLDANEIRKQLTAALAAKLAAEQTAAQRLSQAEERAALLAQTRDELAGQAELTTEVQKQQALLNQQIAALRQQLSGLQGLLDAAEARDVAADVQLQSLGKNLNIALARAAAEERKRRKLEEEKSALLEAETADLQKYRSEFFGRLRDVLGAQEGVQIVGDRFVFSSEVLFAPGQARLSANGQREIAKVARILSNILDDIPTNIDWIIRVDGHTDDVPISGGQFADNWELSQARALSVVRYMISALGLPPDRLSANGFGEFQPINPADTPEARAQNRRIELKFTEK
jgi:chemotaxis protein MotB